MRFSHAVQQLSISEQARNATAACLPLHTRLIAGLVNAWQRVLDMAECNLISRAGQMGN